MIVYQKSNIIKKNIHDGIISVYTIFMLPIEMMKKYLTKTIKSHFLILRTDIQDERKYYGSIKQIIILLHIMKNYF